MGKIVRELVEYNGISTCSPSNAPNFKQMNIDYNFCIPNEKLDIDQVFKVWVDACISSKQLVKTPTGTSLEGQVVTGYKLLVSGDINIKMQYVACNAKGSVHSSHGTFPFCGYVTIPSDINPSSAIGAHVHIEDILIEQLDCRCVYTNITMMLIASVC